ncbi:hypothetical protein C012_01547 [Brucella abortus NI518]|nr:hypothetical protein BAB8416_I1187 [Brucella abortus]ALM34654.1 hypothetical protein BME20236_I1194 [Brucella melitensis]ENP29122.1 hypothetical protein C041_00586 [Brucella abortus 63/59]ENP41191.1 hypothetical protein C055_01089 [Brucella abortus 78/36]ENP57112.1 hypothetical protein C029_01158 [Brucella abortus 88/19]ENP94099.1 hypothetical protein C071_01206 [Brucella abortus F2/06-8]ENQ17605.1 hypothetical protein C015_01202 [Brucella abortus NI274]ENQ29979.1 hypothetical protein C01
MTISLSPVNRVKAKRMHVRPQHSGNTAFTHPFTERESARFGGLCELFYNRNSLIAFAGQAAIFRPSKEL